MTSKQLPPLWREHYLARLHAERANLYWQLRSLDEATLTKPEIMPGYNIKDVLVHIGFYDGFRAGQMQLVQDGRFDKLHEFKSVQALDAFNADILARFKLTPLESVMAMLRKERRSYLAMLNRLDDAEIERPFTMPSEQETHLFDWLNWRYEHDADHANELAKWRSEQDPAQLRNPSPKFLLQAMLRSTRKAFLALLPLIPEEEWTTKPVCGTWTMKDLLGHITDWEKVGVEGMQQLADGHLPEFNYEITDFDAFNNPNAEARKDQPWDEVWHDYETTRNTLVELLEQTSDDQMKRPFTPPWSGEISPTVWILVWAGHEIEHAIDIRSALQLQGWPVQYTEHHP